MAAVKTYRWQCIECKCCNMCGTSENDVSSPTTSSCCAVACTECWSVTCCSRISSCSATTVTGATTCIVSTHPCLNLLRVSSPSVFYKVTGKGRDVELGLCISEGYCDLSNNWPLIASIANPLDKHLTDYLRLIDQNPQLDVVLASDTFWKAWMFFFCRCLHLAELYLKALLWSENDIMSV